MKRFFSTLALALCAFAAIAGQVCTIDPPRPVGSTGLYVVSSRLFDATGAEMRLRQGAEHLRAVQFWQRPDRKGLDLI